MCVWRDGGRGIGEGDQGKCVERGEGSEPRQTLSTLLSLLPPSTDNVQPPCILPVRGEGEGGLGYTHH